MKRTLVLAAKDLAQTVRDWRAAIFLLLMPLAFTLFFGLVAFGSSDVQPVRVGWVDQDGGPVGASLRGFLSTSSTLLVEMKDEEAAAELVRDGKLAAAVIVPEGFGASALAGAPRRVAALSSQNTADGRAAVEAIRVAADHALAAAAAARASLDSAAAWDAGLRTDAVRREAFLRRGLRLAETAWSAPGVQVVLQAAGTVRAPGGFSQASPGMIVQFAVFGLVTSAMVLVQERKSRALRRLLSTPIARSSILAGHIIAMFVIVLLQELVLVVVGQLAFGVDYLAAPAGTLLMMAATAAWAASLGMLIGALARKEQQVVAYSLAAMFFFAALGGAWFPLEVAGKGFARVGGLLPSAWAMVGFQNIVLRGLGSGSALMPAGIIAAWAVAFFGIASWRFRFE